MKFSKEDIEYLQGNKFSNGFKLLISHKECSVPTRMEYVEDIVKNKNIIHVGFADHIPLVVKKIKEDKWFHKRLVECTKRCLGVDTNKEAVDYCKRLGYVDIINFDIENDEVPPQISQTKWDYILVAEILEHVNNPAAFLEVINKKYWNIIDKIIVTVPNAFRFENFQNSRKHMEHINTDHRYWFTPYTLGKIITKAGMKIEHFQFCQRSSPSKRGLSNYLKYVKLKRYPSFRDTLIMTAKLG